MDNQKKNYKLNLSLILILIFVALFCFSVWYLKSSENFILFDVEVTHSDNGIWDLREVNFSDEIIITGGNTEYIAGELLFPEEFEQRSKDIIIGQAWKESVNTIKLTMIMPDDNTYMVMGNSVDYSEKLYINGELRKETGKVGLTLETSEPGHSYFAFEVKPENGVIEIVRQANNFVHRENGIGVNLTIGSPELVNRQRTIEYGINGLIIGLLFALAISHLFLVNIFKNNKAHFYFAILSIFWGLRVGVTDIKIFGSWFVDLPWEVMFRIEYISGPITSMMILLIANQIFPKKIPSIFLKTCVSLFTLYSLCCIILPTIELSYSMLIFQVVYISASIILSIILAISLVRMIQEKTVRLEQILFVMGFLPFIFAMVHDALFFNNIQLFGINILLNDFGLLIIVFTQSASIFYNTAKKTEDAYHAEQASKTEAAALKRVGILKETFLRSLSHELQIPITTISGFAQLTGQIIDEDDTIDRLYIVDNMRVINDESRRLSRMVSQLLDASAMENGTFKLNREKVSIIELMNKLENLHFPIINDESNKLKIELDDCLPSVYVDEERVMYAILNLFSNAIKHTRDGLITIYAKNKNDFVEIEVKDTGEGITEELLKDVFTQYPEHRSNKGNGLGLYIVSQTIKAHGGDINIESKINEGTSVRFTIPTWKEDFYGENM